MSPDSPIEKLRMIAADARDLFHVLADLASLGKRATGRQRRKLERLAKSLDTVSREAARDRREKEIGALEDVVRAHQTTLEVPGLPRATRDVVRSDLIRKKARRTRLMNLEATDFGGVLTQAEVGRILEIAEKAEREVAGKEFAAELLDLTFRVADLALSLAGRFDL
jgi:hypothetical protein